MTEQPNPYVEHYGIKPELPAAFDAYLQKQLGKYLLHAAMYGLDSAIQRMYDDHNIDRNTGETTE